MEVQFLTEQLTKAVCTTNGVQGPKLSNPIFKDTSRLSFDEVNLLACTMTPSQRITATQLSP